MIQEEKRRPIYVIQNVRDYGEYNHEIYGMKCLYSITFFGLEREGGIIFIISDIDVYSPAQNQNLPGNKIWDSKAACQIRESQLKRSHD